VPENLQKFWMDILEGGLIFESPEAADANKCNGGRSSRKARWHPSRLAKPDKSKSSYDQIVGSHQ
jgi:hypothetical protein